MTGAAAERAVDWDGFHNARDLGGLPTRDGRRTHTGAFYRSATLVLVTDRGWQEARDAGVRTVVDLRNDDEVESEAVDPVGMTRVRVPLDGIEDVELWRHLREEGLDGTPMYYLPFLSRRPDRVAAVMTALARSEPGVVFHCSAGRDRTGLVTLLLLALAGVEPEAVATDYELTVEPLKVLYAAAGRPDDSAEVAGFLAARGTTAPAAVLATLEQLDVEAYLRDAGVADADVAELRARLRG
ncbi:tyrosine-protein phosphatase [Blastococcus litoris]|uniref:tyrosine-protein phosphatase n=1 Tax=Blastococcus litoris TaxID=2171622 RepID=UPI000E2FFD67|nr:tyrosine-protein phosphatase [Blastococcus litoris]